jgi:hypothetical protein
MTLKMTAIFKILKQVKADKNTDDWRKFSLKKLSGLTLLLPLPLLILKQTARFGSWSMAHQLAPFF